MIKGEGGGLTKPGFLCSIMGMRKLWWVLLFMALFSACAQTPSENNSSGQKPGISSSRSSKKKYRFYIDVSSQVIGFNIMVNGAELLVVEGGSGFSSKININDWMVSGNNKLDITVFWPDNMEFSSGISSALFRLYSNDTVIKEFKWPLSSPELSNSYPHFYTETFKANGFPKVLLEGAERVISSAGTLPREDQNEIAAIAQQLRTALTEKDFDIIDSLFRTKYEDLATARFISQAVIKDETNAKFRDLMDKPGYSVLFNGRNSYFSAAEDRAVRLGQGRIGFPEPALIIVYREGRNTVRWTMDLYFAKIDGKWVIIR